MKEALKLALEALQLVSIEFVCNGAHHARKDRHDWLESCPVVERYQVAITAARKALEQPDYRAVKTYHEGKPVYVSQPEQELEYCVDYHCAGDCGQPHNQQERQAFLVAQPLKRPWVGLTEDEIIAVDMHTLRVRGDGYTYARAIEAKLKEKNNGN